MKTKEYPKVDHSEVRCPSCHRSLADVPHRAHPFPDAPFAKHCGAPCFGTAWYSYQAPVRHEYLNYAARPWPIGSGSQADPLGQRTPGVGDEVQSITIVQDPKRAVVMDTKTYDWGASIPVNIPGTLRSRMSRRLSLFAPGSHEFWLNLPCKPETPG